MDILYLSHCVPGPPDKGERIRAHHEIAHLAVRHRVHLACFARDQAEEEAARRLSDRCASVYMERLSYLPTLAGAALRFALGDSLTTAFYQSRRLKEYIHSLLQRVPVAATVAYSSAMAPFAPQGIPLLLDMVDVDSEKWLQYARMRRPGPLYAIEAGRLRRIEAHFAQLARCTLLATSPEADLLRNIAPQAIVRDMENGVDFEFFDPSRTPLLPQLAQRRLVVLVGAMDYYPNSDAACWFASYVLPDLRRRDPDLEFWIVGRNPSKAVSRLASRNGVTVTGGVGDVRPYLAGAIAMVAPLRIVRGIQNKVLEALAMGKRVLASRSVCRTFGTPLPPGLIACHTAEEYVHAIIDSAQPAITAERIQGAARTRFSWSAKMETLLRELNQVAGA